MQVEARPRLCAVRAIEIPQLGQLIFAESIVVLGWGRHGERLRMPSRSSTTEMMLEASVLEEALVRQLRVGMDPVGVDHELEQGSIEHHRLLPEPLLAQGKDRLKSRCCAREERREESLLEGVTGGPHARNYLSYPERQQRPNLSELCLGLEIEILFA